MKKYKLGEIAEIEISGVDKKTKEGEIPVKLCNFVDVYHNWAITKDLYDEFMDASARQSEIDIYKLKKGQVAFTKDSETRDDIGIPTYIADNFDDVILGYHTALVTPNREFLNGKYLNAFMNSRYIQKYFEFNASGSGQRYTLSNDTLNNIPILAPDLNTQSKIGELFSSLDKKIALNSRINARLEQMAKNLYEHYFVQFDFPTEDGKPYKTSGGKMVYSSELKREIPEGWEVKRLGELNVVSRGTTITQKQTTKGNIKVVAGGLTYSYTNGESNRRKNCITVSGSGENAGFVNFWREPIFASDCSTVQFEDDFDTIICYFNLKMHEHIFFRNSHKSAQPHVYPSDIKEIPFVIPPKEVKEKIKDLFLKANDKIAILQQESARLTSLRDRLLPLLMNGQVSV